MRPIKLTMQAFGAYREKTVLDFGRLGDRNFFLIHGPTGSGKTTILDAICFALYGETSGQLRTSKTVRSDFADAGLRTYVELVFSIGEDVYRIERSPEQERAKMRGDGTMLEKPQAMLWKASSDGEKILASSTRSVTEAVEAMLGFECNQFRQVVLLPQGEFRKLLSANSTDRQEIMKALFRTGIYEKIENHLKQKASGVKKLFEEVEQERRFILETSGVASEAELVQEIAKRSEEETELVAQVAEQKQILAQKETALTEGKQIEALFAEYLVSQNAYKSAQTAQQEAFDLRGAWQTAKKAQTLAMSDQYLTQEEELCAKKRDALIQAEKTLAEADALLGKAERDYTREKERDVQREKAREERNRLEKLTEGVRLLLTADKEHQTAVALAKRAEADYRDKQEKCQTYEKALEELTKQREAKLEEAKRLAVLSEEKEKLTRLYQTSAEKDAISREIVEQEKQLTHVRIRVDKLAENVKRSQEVCREAELRWQKAQAGILATTLMEGAPCPVCGSLHHPMTAKLAESISEEELKKAKRTAEIALAEHTKANLELATLVARQEARVQKREELSLVLGQAEETAVLQEKLVRLTEQVKAATGAAEDAERLKTRIANGEQMLADTVKARDDAQSMHQKAVGVVRAAQAILEERRGQVPSELMADGALDMAKRQADMRIKKLTEDWQRADTAYQKAQADVAKAKADTEALQKGVAEQETKCQTLFKKLSEEAIGLGFGDRDALRCSLRPSDWLDKTEKHLRSIDDTVLATRERCTRAKQATEGKVRPNLVGLSEAKKLAEDSYLAVVKKRQTLEDMIQTQKSRQKKLADCAKRIGDLEMRYRIVGQLAGIAGGNNEKNLTFQRYVLSELLTEVAEVASVRLLKMSRNRYMLRRTDSLSRKNAAGGLELEVFDNLTGVARPVGTLSGGEGFLASLALALGLADVVQSYAGGIWLDTMLIDEGFGTLDPETLDFAISTLLDLQRDGRLVGIISHVPELTERIDARLEVLQTNHGSTAVFHVG